MTFSAFLAWIQTTRVANTIGDSTLLTGFLSAIHLLGLTLLVGGALVSGLRLLGVLLRDHPLADVAAPASRGMLVGLAISVGSGLLLFAPRASAAAGNGIFQIKMLLLVMATAFHLAVYRHASRQIAPESRRSRFTGACGLGLWFGVALAGCAFILFE